MIGLFADNRAVQNHRAHADEAFVAHLWHA